MSCAMQAFIACYCAISLIKSVLERRNYFELETDGYYNRKAKVLQHYKNKSLYHFGKNSELLKEIMRIKGQLFYEGKTSTLTEITDSVKKESKTLVFGSFCMFFAHF